MLHEIEFEYGPEITPDVVYTVRASVHLGKTSARGDDPDDVISLYVIDAEGGWLDVPQEIYQDLCELSIIEAKSQRGIG